MVFLGCPTKGLRSPVPSGRECQYLQVVGTWLFYYSSEQLAFKLRLSDAKAVHFYTNSTKISSAYPHKKEKQCGSGAEKEWHGFSAKAQPHGLSFCTQGALHTMPQHAERWRIFEIIALLPKFQPVLKPLQYSRNMRFFTIYFKYAFVASQISCCFSVLSQAACCSSHILHIHTSLLLLTVNLLAHLPGSPTVLGHHNN